jgi:hypothetical protein
MALAMMTMALAMMTVDTVVLGVVDGVLGKLLLVVPCSWPLVGPRSRLLAAHRPVGACLTEFP